MKTGELYQCASVGIDDIPVEIRESGAFPFPQIHFDAGLMVNLAVALKNNKHDVFAHVPFCLTVESEALGGIINPGNERNGPRVKEYAYTNMAELLDIDFDRALVSAARVQTVMEAVRALAQDGPVVLNVNGVFTTLVSLIDINTLYKAMRKDRETVDAVFCKLKEFILRFTELGLENGAKVISYADPVGDLTLMGAKTFQEFAAPITGEIIRESLELLGTTRIFHLCGRMTNGLSQAGFLRAGRVEIADADSYGAGMLQLLGKENITFIGNNCIKKTGLKNGGQSVILYPLEFVE